MSIVGNCPRCDCLLNLAPTRSPALFRQKAGRIGRVLPGVIDGITDPEARKAAITASPKPDALILDLLWQTERFGLQGPADLVAFDNAEKEALQARLRRLSGAFDLQEVSSKVQEEREAALKKALDEAAKRRREFTGAPLQLVAATLHGKKVLAYQPVMKWEKLPMTDKQRAWLERNGIDPETVKDRGHVSALMHLIFRRREAGLAPWRVVQALEANDVANALLVRDWTAYEILGGAYPMPFGKHARKNTPLAHVPLDYLEWCAHSDRRGMLNQYPIVADWIERQLPANAQNPSRCTCIGGHQAPNCPVHPKQAEMFDALA